MKIVVTVLLILALFLVGCAGEMPEKPIPSVQEKAKEETFDKDIPLEQVESIETIKSYDHVYERMNFDESSKPFALSYVPFFDENNDRVEGLIDSNGKLVASIKYEYCSGGKEFSYAYINTSDGKNYKDIFGNDIDPSDEVCTFIDCYGKEVFGYYTYATEFSDEGLAVVKDAIGRFHTINKSGNIISTLDNNSVAQVEIIHDGMALFQTHDREYGYLNDKLEIVIEPEFSYGRAFSEGLAYVCQNDKTYYINKSGTVVIELPEEAGEPWEEYVFFQGSDKYDAWDFSDGLAYVFLPARSVTDENGNETWVEADGYYIDKNGNKVLEIIAGTKFVNGLAAAYDKETDKCGYIDKSGNFIIEPKYVLAYSFNESGLALVMEDENYSYDFDRKFGYINSCDEVVIPLKYTVATMFPIDNMKDGIVRMYDNENLDTVYYIRCDGTVLGKRDRSIK